LAGWLGLDSGCRLGGTPVFHITGEHRQFPAFPVRVAGVVPNVPAARPGGL